MRRSFQAYNASQQIPNTRDRGYHETITAAFMRLVKAALISDGPFTDSNTFCDAHPELLDKAVLGQFYSKDHLMTEFAKREFVEPDLRRLPEIRST